MAQTPFTFTKPYDHPAKVNDKTGAARRVTAYQAKAYDGVPADVAERAEELGYGAPTPADGKAAKPGKAATDGGASTPGSTTTHGATNG